MLIDCDVHHSTPTREEWVHYVAPRYKAELERYGTRRMLGGIRSEDGGNRWDASASKPEHVIEQLLDPYGHSYGLLTGVYGCIAGIPDADYAAEICKAYNDYTIERWLPADERFVMAMKIPLQDAELAVEEIHRLAGHPRIKAITVAAGAERIPLDNAPTGRCTKQRAITIFRFMSIPRREAEWLRPPRARRAMFRRTCKCIRAFLSFIKRI